MDTIIDIWAPHGKMFSTAPEHIGATLGTRTQEKMTMLKELDAAMKTRYHQSLDDVLRDLYMHNVISKQDLSVEEIIRTLESISVLKNEMSSILERFRR